MARRIEGFATDARVLPAIFAVAILLRVATVVLLPLAPMSDSAWYLERGAEIARGMGFQEAGHPTAFWPVGYPALLAGAATLFGPGMAGAAIVNIVAAIAILATIVRLGRTLGMGEAAVRIAALAYALYPAHIAYVADAAVETASTAVAMLAILWLIEGWRRPALFVPAGIAFGVGTLMRAQLLLFPIGGIVAIMLVARSRDWRRGLVALLLVHAAMAAVVAPWSLRNIDQLGFAGVSTNGGIGIYTGASDEATGEHLDWQNGPIWAETGIPRSDRIARQVELDARAGALGKAWIAAHPARWLALGVAKVALVWRKDTDGFWAYDYSYPRHGGVVRAAEVVDQLYYLAILAFGIAGLAAALGAWWRHDVAGTPPLLLATMPAFVTLTAFVFSGQTRYHYPAMPFLILAAGGIAARLLAGRRTA